MIMKKKEKTKILTIAFTPREKIQLNVYKSMYEQCIGKECNMDEFVLSTLADGVKYRRSITENSITTESDGSGEVNE
jgi:hypothetical protein